MMMMMMTVILWHDRQRDTATSFHHHILLHAAYRRRRQLRLSISLVDTGSRLRRTTTLQFQSLVVCFFDVTVSQDESVIDSAKTIAYSDLDRA